LSADDETLLHRALLETLRFYGNTTLPDETLLKIFMELTDDDPNVPLLTYFCEKTVGVERWPRIVSGNGIFVNERIVKSEWEVLPAVRYLKFDEKTVEVLNDLIEKWTRGLIMNALGGNAITEDMRYVIVNTLAFIGKWREPFKTVDQGTFHGDDGAVETSFLVGSGSFKYRADDGFQYVAIRYAGGPFKLELIVPPEGKKLSKVVKSGPERFAEMASNAAKIRVDLRMPEFNITSPGIDFSSKFAIPSSASLRQVAVISVDQFGTKAAAGTVIIEKGIVESDVVLVVDRPFMFQIRGKRYGEVLFAGVVQNPKE
jgi:serine protease inhibitor